LKLHSSVQQQILEGSTAQKDLKDLGQKRAELRITLYKGVKATHDKAVK
jgi:hypothetical protein